LGLTGESPNAEPGLNSELKDILDVDLASDLLLDFFLFGELCLLGELNLVFLPILDEMGDFVCCDFSKLLPLNESMVPNYS
jgi:hypothetical protein